MPEEKDPAAISLGKRGGRKTARRGAAYYREIQAKRKERKGGRPRIPRRYYVALRKGKYVIIEKNINQSEPRGALLTSCESREQAERYIEKDRRRTQPDTF